MGRDSGHLSRVVGLNATNRDESVCAARNRVGDDVLQLAELVTAIGQTAADVLALGPDLRACEVRGQAGQAMDGAWPERQRVTGELLQPHWTFFTLDGGSVCVGSTLAPRVETLRRREAPFSVTAGWGLRVRTHR